MLEVETYAPFDCEILGIGRCAVAVCETPYESDVAEFEYVGEAKTTLDVWHFVPALCAIVEVGRHGEDVVGVVFRT